MGRATIVSGGSEGKYQVKLDLGHARMTARKAQLQLRLDNLEAVIAQSEPVVAQARVAWEAAKAELAPVIEAYGIALAAQNGSPDSIRAVEVAMKNVVTKTNDIRGALATYHAVRAGLDRFKMEHASFVATLATLSAVETQRTVDAWCADLTEDIAAEKPVITIEVPSHEALEVLVAPGGDSPHSGTGILLKRAAMSSEQAYYNAAVLPGVQKWRPLYALATIDALDSSADTATVTFLSATSSVDAFAVAPGTTRERVPVRYMTCNAAAFEVGDEVVVQFPTQRIASAIVIGFRRNPKPCLKCLCLSDLGYFFQMTSDVFNKVLNAVAGSGNWQFRMAGETGWTNLQFTYNQNNEVTGRSEWIYEGPGTRFYANPPYLFFSSLYPVWENFPTYDHQYPEDYLVRENVLHVISGPTGAFELRAASGSGKTLMRVAMEGAGQGVPITGRFAGAGAAPLKHSNGTAFGKPLVKIPDYVFGP